MNTLSRRGLLRYAGMSCLAIPLMRSLMEEEAFAATSPLRALFVYYPDGNIANRFFPDGNGNLPDITSPLRDLRGDISFIRGLAFRTNGSHESGAQFCLTGTSRQDQRYSIDNFLGDSLGAQYQQKNLRLGVGANFQSGPDKHLTYLSSGAIAPVQDNPKRAFYDLFNAGGLENKGDLLAQKRSVLDYARGEVQSLRYKLGTTEQKKLAVHIEALRELERRAGQNSTATCSRDVNWRGLSIPDQENGYPKSFEMNDAFGKVGKIMTDIMVQALACGITPVGLLQWSHAVSPTNFNFAGGPGLPLGHHDVSHYGGDAYGLYGNHFANCQRWYMEQVAYLLNSMKAVNLGDKNLLDASMVLVTTELGDSNLHDFKDIACLVAGRAGGKLRSGQNLNLQDRSYNHLLISLIHAAGIPNPTFGDPMLGNGPIGEILG